MKARIRKTGEIVDIICWCGTYERNDSDNVSYIDSDGNEHSQEKGLNYHWDFEIIDDIIDWEQRRYEIAKAAMQGFCANPSERIVLASFSQFADWSLTCANTLINKLKQNN